FGNGASEAYTVSLWGVGMSHVILEVAEAETVTAVEGRMRGSANARFLHSAGVDGHITPARIAVERRKPCFRRRVGVGGRLWRGMTGAMGGEVEGGGSRRSTDEGGEGNEPT